MKLGEAIVELNAKFSKFDAALQEAKARTIRGAQSISAAWTKAAGVVGLLLGGAAIIGAAEESDQATRRLEATIRLMGNTSGITSKQVKDLADQLARTSQFDDDAIVNAATAMMEFSNVRGDIFKDAAQVAVDLASRTGDLEGSFRALGAALNDPINGLSLLRRQYRALSPAIIDQARAMAMSGNIAGAQRFILDELSRKTQGLAKSMQSPIGEAKKAISELAEGVGKAIGPMVSDFARASKAVADFFAQLTDKKPVGEVILGEPEVDEGFFKKAIRAATDVGKRIKGMGVNPKIEVEPEADPEGAGGAGEAIRNEAFDLEENIAARNKAIADLNREMNADYATSVKELEASLDEQLGAWKAIGLSEISAEEYRQKKLGELARSREAEVAREKFEQDFAAHVEKMRTVGLAQITDNEEENERLKAQGFELIDFEAFKNRKLEELERQRVDKERKAQQDILRQREAFNRQLEDFTIGVAKTPDDKSRAERDKAIAAVEKRAMDRRKDALDWLAENPEHRDWYDHTLKLIMDERNRSLADINTEFAGMNLRTPDEKKAQSEREQAVKNLEREFDAMRQKAFELTGGQGEEFQRMMESIIAGRDEKLSEIDQKFMNDMKESTEKRKSLIRGLIGDISSGTEEGVELDIKFQSDEMMRRAEEVFGGAANIPQEIISAISGIEEERLKDAKAQASKIEFIGLEDLARQIQTGQEEKRMTQEMNDNIKRLTELMSRTEGLPVTVKNAEDFARMS